MITVIGATVTTLVLVSLGWVAVELYRADRPRDDEEAHR